MKFLICLKTKFWGLLQNKMWEKKSLLVGGQRICVKQCDLQSLSSWCYFLQHCRPAWTSLTMYLSGFQKKKKTTTMRHNFNVGGVRLIKMRQRKREGLVGF